MNRRAIITLALLSVFHLTATQILLSSASYSPNVSIASMGTIRENVVKPTRIIKHLVAYDDWFSTATADFIASKFDVVDVSYLCASTIYKIKAVNPNIVILMYRDIMMVQPFDEDWDDINLHEDWFLHDKAGNRLVHKVYGCYAMDVGNSGWRSHYADFVKEKLENYPFDGLFADDVWEWLSYHNTVWTVDPSLVPTEIKERWHNDTLGMIKFVKESIGEKLLIINTSNYGDYVDACDGKMEEGFVHPSWYALDEFHDEAINWTREVESLREISQAGKYYLAQSGTEIPQNPTEADLTKVNNIMLYCLATYLLGVNGEKGTFGFNNIWSGDGSRGYYPEFDVQLGAPINDYYGLGSVYARDFEKGKVLVNPTLSSCIINLDNLYKTLDGRQVSNITLNSRSGTILMRY